MTNYTQKYIGLIEAPWTKGPQIQFATFTFDDATSAAFPTYASVREEMARRSAFNDADATTTGDTWGSDANEKAIELSHVRVLWIAELNDYVNLNPVCPPAIPESYVWPQVGTTGLNTNLGGLAAFTIAGDDFLAGNISDADDTPPVVATVPTASPGSIEAGDHLVIALNNKVAYDQVFAVVSSNLAVPAADVSLVSSAGTYTIEAFIQKANGATSRVLQRTLTNS